MSRKRNAWRGPKNIKKKSRKEEILEEFMSCQTSALSEKEGNVSGFNLVKEM